MNFGGNAERIEFFWTDNGSEKGIKADFQLP